VPVKALTNGVHVPTWMSAEIARLLDRYLGPDWLESHDDPGLCDRVLEIPDEELWAARVALRTFLFQFVRERARQRWTTEGGSAARVVAAGTMFDQSALTIGYARRFTGYKRPELLFTDPQRLAGILNKWGRPVQFVFAGKAHPADRPGQRVIQEIFQRSRSPQLRGRVFILEDYDIRVGRYLVQGVDVWLNNPRRPLEASGTSGMKAAQNGVPNISVLDGWWDEGFGGDNGWAIGDRETDPDEAAQDWADAQDLYHKLENELIPAYYTRDAGGDPTRWIATMRRAMATTLWSFSTTRMLQEYTERLYLPAGMGSGSASNESVGAKPVAAEVPTTSSVTTEAG